MGLNHSTISREVRRNSMSSRDYIPQKAHALALKRRKDSAKSKLSELTVTFVEYCLSLKWSPEQIAGVGKFIGYSVCHEWIYNYIYSDKLRGGSLYRQLRHNGRKYYKGSRSKRMIIPNRVGI
jgi:IS30 family transposase